MRSGKAALLAALLAASFPATARAEPKPYETIRALQTLQDQIALGDAVAEAAHAKTIERTGRAFAKAKPAVWADPRNARALVIYLFSGGSAAAIADAVPAEIVAADLRKLYAGALAYGLGDDETARTGLMPIDARGLPSGLGGRLALVQAILCADTAPPKAIALLDLARLLEPGTLVEEAALRKELSMVGATGDTDKFGLLARRYAGAFARSVYAENFRQLLNATATQVGTGDTKADTDRLAKIAAAIDRDERRRIYLGIAREAVLAGHTTMAAFAAAEAAKLARSDGPEAARAGVYLGAATIFGKGYQDGRKALVEATVARLDGRDRALRDSALAVADMIRREPVASKDGRIEAMQAAVVDEGERAIARADDTMRKAQK